MVLHVIHGNIKTISMATFLFDQQAVFYAFPYHGCHQKVAVLF